MNEKNDENISKEKFKIRVIFDENGRCLEDVIEEAFVTYLQKLNTWSSWLYWGWDKKVWNI